MSKSRWIAAAALGMALSGPALAEYCADTTWSTLAATACVGSLTGNTGAGATLPGELAFLDASWPTYAPFSFVGKSDDADSGPFTSNPGVSTNGTLTFDAPITTAFVIGLKAANNTSYYRFDPSSPVTSLNFDSTAGVALNAQGMPQVLSHASLFVTPIPEPSTYALLALGLPVLWLARRRRQNG